MKKLSAENFERAKIFIQEKARPLEKHLFNFHFESGSAQAVLDALAKHQNEDGGFGHALEPDFRLKNSSPMATTVGLQILREVDAANKHPMAQSAIHYLTKNYQQHLDRWISVPESVSDVPHAPWWHVAGPEEPGFTANPSAEIVAHLWHYAPLSSENLRETTLSLALDLLKKTPDQMEFHDMLCWIWLIKSDHVPQDAQETVRTKLIQATPHVVTTDPDQWSGYAAKPLWFAPSPDAPLASVLEKDVQVNLDYEIEQQAEDGTWSPIWNWGDQYEDAWAQAKREWKGILTLNLLKSFKAYGRLG